jgi:hypothetical protein
MTAQVLDIHPAFEFPVSGDDPFADFRLVDGNLWPRIAEGKRRA